MTNTEVVVEIIEAAQEAFTFLLPIIGIMAGINYIASWIMHLTVYQGSKVFGK